MGRSGWSQAQNIGSDRVSRCKGGALYSRRTMRLSSFEILIETEPDDEGYAPRSSTPSGCFSNETTVEEAKCNIREVSQQQLETLLAHGHRIPQNERLVRVEERTVGGPILPTDHKIGTAACKVIAAPPFAAAELWVFRTGRRQSVSGAPRAG
jgi:predicted RNase H-like HicB family nuclease